MKHLTVSERVKLTTGFTPALIVTALEAEDVHPLTSIFAVKEPAESAEKLPELVTVETKFPFRNH